VSEHDRYDGPSPHTDSGGREGSVSAGSPPAGTGVALAGSAPDRAEPIDRAMSAGSSGLDVLSAAVQALSVRLEDLTCLIKTRLSYDKVKEEAFDRIYADLDQLKKNAAQDNIKPLLLDLILLYDRMEQAHREATSVDVAGGLIATETVKSFIEELLEVLYRRDVALVEVLSPAFDPNQQRAISVENVADQAQHQHVAAVVRRGFRLGSRVLRPEEVIVRRFVEPINTNADSNSRSEG
jgi:molecular chaperone GrpE